MLAHVASHMENADVLEFFSIIRILRSFKVHRANQAPSKSSRINQIHEIHHHHNPHPHSQAVQVDAALIWAENPAANISCLSQKHIKIRQTRVCDVMVKA